jgi:hypothetical protein
MDKKTKGAWLIHHTNKLQGITNHNQYGYDKIYVAGKAGILLSAISTNKDNTVDDNRLTVLAKAANINPELELPRLIEVLQQQKLIDKSSGGVAVLGVTTATVLQHTSDLFDSLAPDTNEAASIGLSEYASMKPILANDVATELADTYKLTDTKLSQLFSDAKQIGFVDTEELGSNQTLLFNGNLFRRDTTQKIKAVLDSLKPSEQEKLNELTEILKQQTCVNKDHATNVLGKSLFDKVTAIGLFDISVVSNSTEDAAFLTLPSAFSKYSNSMVDDAFDLAKAFVSSITYGMTKSHHERGQIKMIGALLGALVRGECVGPVQAIAEDYKVLELKGVVEVKQGSKKGRSGPMLRLLKKEVGELALQAIQQGDVSEHSLSDLPTAAVTIFDGPEHNREKIRSKQTKLTPEATNDMLSILRSGGGL